VATLHPRPHSLYPFSCLNESSALLDALLSMTECGPDICESFFTPLVFGEQQGTTSHVNGPCEISRALPANLFEICLDMLR